jgi:hypothetical protein
MLIPTDENQSDEIFRVICLLVMRLMKEEKATLSNWLQDTKVSLHAILV